MTDQTRADFEAHFGLTTRQAWTHPDGSYKFPEIQAKWEGYLAGVAKAGSTKRAPLSPEELKAVLDNGIDAARYRWLRDKANKEGRDGGWWGYYVFPHLKGWDDTPFSINRGEGYHFNTVDEAVDAAMQGQVKQLLR